MEIGGIDPERVTAADAVGAKDPLEVRTIVAGNRKCERGHSSHPIRYGMY